jgi:hypothetical protein
VNAPADERLTAGDTGILDTSVPRLLVAAALVGETAFSDLPQTMTELMRVVQQGDAFAYGLIHELNQSKEIRLETRPGVWPETVYSGFEGCVSILKDHTVREKFWKFRTNHDDS